MSKILFYTPMNLRYGGGFEEWLRKTVDVLSVDNQVTVMYGLIGSNSRYSDDEVEQHMKNATSLIAIRFFKLKSIYILDPRDFMKFLRTFKNTDFVYFNYAFLFQEILVYFASKLTGKKIVVGFHAPIHFSKFHDIMFNVYASRILKKFAGFHALNQETFDALLDKGFSNVNKIANYILKKDVICRARLNRPLRYLFVGRYAAQKGTDLLVEAIEKFMRKNPDTDSTFVFCGFGAFQEQVQLLARKYPKTVEDLGYIRDKDAIYNDASYVVIPSRQDQMSMTLLESQGYGIPVIATMVAGANEIVNDMENGIVIKNVDVGSICESLSKADATSEHQRQAMSGNAQKIIREKYTEDTFCSKIMQLFVSAQKSGIH